MGVHECKPRPVKYCADCGEVIAGPDTPIHRYNRIRYCPLCARERTLYNRANFQKQFRLDRKARDRLMRQQISLLLKENAELRSCLAYWENRNQEVNGFV